MKIVVLKFGGTSVGNLNRIKIVAKIIARYPNTLDELKISEEDPAKAAIIAPTIITEEIALVTDISGVCKDGVTLQTT